MHPHMHHQHHQNHCQHHQNHHCHLPILPQSNSVTPKDESEPRTTSFQLSNPPTPYFLCNYCEKISDTLYFCFAKPCNFERKVAQFQLYNQPNNYTVSEIIKHCNKDYIYEENVDNFNKRYDPYITRCKVNDEFDTKGKRIKKDHPGFCKYCSLNDKLTWDANFYERNNSRYRGHMINTHGIHPNGNTAKMPTAGCYSYKWIRNHWFESSGFYCPYDNCKMAFTIGEKGHGFHEYLRHWAKNHVDVV